MDVWPEVDIVKEYTGFELEVEEPPLDEPRYGLVSGSFFGIVWL